ncbi:MAG: hypothetical protein ABR517_03725 [Thermoanaerobaculia bacterium]
MRVVRVLLVVALLGIPITYCMPTGVAPAPPVSPPVIGPGDQPTTGQSIRGTDEKFGSRELTWAPPVAERAAVQMLSERSPEGNAILMVQFAAAAPAPTVLRFRTERETVVLRDDGVAPDQERGDRIHSGFLNVDAGDLEPLQRSLARAAEPIPVFAGRQLVARARGVERESLLTTDFRSIPIIPSRANLGPQRREISMFEIPITRFDRDRLVPLFPFVDPASVDAAASLVVTDPGVIGDPNRTFNPCTNVGNPNGKWTFGHLMEQLANQPVTGIPADVFARRWLRRWELTQTVNDWTIPARAAGVQARIITPWLAASGGTTLDLSKAPFQLLAIVNRIDLRENLIYGGGSAGEGRFVFGLIDMNTCQPQPMTVIFEYGITKNGCAAVKQWGQQWLDLQDHTVGSAAYNAALEAITDQFAEANTNPGQHPNRSSLNQLRTNEISLGSPWELREFRLAGDDSDQGHLRQVTVKQTPDDSLNNTAVIGTFVNAHSAAVLQDKHEVTPDFPMGFPFLGGRSLVAPSNIVWDGTAPHPSASISGTVNLRHHFSFNTCNGCHGGETSTPFTHIGAAPGQISGFMTGITVPAPFGEATNPPGGSRHFNDLLRRQQDLAGLLSQRCFMNVFFDPLRMVH